MATCQLNRSKNQITGFHKIQETSAGNLRTYSSNNCELKWYSNDCETREKHHEKVQLEWGKNSKVFYKRNVNIFHAHKFNKIKETLKSYKTKHHDKFHKFNCVLFIYTIPISILCASRKELSLIEANQKIYDFYNINFYKA